MGLFLFTNEECILSCFYSLNNKKIWVSRKKSNFAFVEIRKFVFVGSFSLLYCHEFGQHLRKLRKFAQIHFQRILLFWVHKSFYTIPPGRLRNLSSRENVAGTNYCYRHLHLRKNSVVTITMVSAKLRGLAKCVWFWKIAFLSWKNASKGL